jgi:signal transduction histidine kinase
MPLEAAMADAKLLNHYLNISRLLAGQLDFRSAIRAVAAEIAHIIPHDHLDVCILMIDGRYHTAYETGLDTEWGQLKGAPVANSPIRTLLWGKEDFILTADASQDPRFHFEGAFDGPIFHQALRSRVHVPIKVGGETIGALSCSSHRAGVYSERDVANARSIADLLSAYFFALRAAEQAQRSAIVEAEARAREEGLRQGALNLTEALERERQRIGMDLHDQTLADLTRLARRLEKLGGRGKPGGEALEPLLQALQMSIKDLRQIIEQACPSVLQLFGFAEAVENHLERSIRESGTLIEPHLHDLSDGIIDQLNQTVRIALFRIVQEAINNAVRHAGAANIGVRIERRRGGVCILVSDDGEMKKRAKPRLGGGMDNMKTRARLIAATLTIGNQPEGKGTLVRVDLACPEISSAATPAHPQAVVQL